MPPRLAIPELPTAAARFGRFFRARRAPLTGRAVFAGEGRAGLSSPRAGSKEPFPLPTSGRSAAASQGGRPAAFLDRDGTIIREYGHFWEPNKIELIPGAADAIRRLKGAGFLCIVTTNQSAVARGVFDEHQFWIGQGRLEELLLAEGLKLDAVYFCPHHPTIGEPPYRMDCECRKPKPGMILRATREYGIDLSRSFMVGDSPADVGAGKAAGVRVVRVRTTYGRAVTGLVPEQLPDGTDPRLSTPDFQALSLEEASHWILAQRR